MRRLAPLFLSLPLAVAFLCAGVGTVRAQQGSFHFEPTPPPLHAQQDSPSQTIPQARKPPPPANPSNAGLQISDAYLGCWEGEPRADAWHQYSGPPIEKWVPGSVTLCFVRTPSGIEVAYHKQSLDEAANQGRIFNTRSRTVALGSAGDHIALRSYGSAQQRGHLFGLPLGPTIDIKWMADSVCTLLPDEKTMVVSESMNQFCSGSKRCNGGPFVSAVWHGTFHKAATL